MARRVEESDHAARRFHVVRADVLGDAAGFAAGHARAANVVEQGSLAVIDVAHHGDHRRSRLQHHGLLVLRLGQEGIRIVELGALRNVPHLLDHDHRGVLIQHLVDRHHGAELHQRFDDFGRLDRHLLRQVRDGDGLGYQDLVHDRLGRQRKRVRSRRRWSPS